MIHPHQLTTANFTLKAEASQPFLQELLQRVRQRRLEITSLSVYWNDEPVLRWQAGRVVFETPVEPGPGLLKIYFDGDLTPAYELTIP